MFSEIPDDSKTNNNDEELNNVLLYTQQFLNDEENKNKKKSKKKSKKKKTIKNQDPEKILRSIEKKIKSDKSNYDNVNSLLVFTRSLLNKYEKYKIKAKVDCDKEIKRERGRRLWQDYKVDNRDSKYNENIDYPKNNTLIPDIEEYQNLLETVKEIVNKNWNNENLNKRLSYETEPIINENDGEVTLTRFPEFFKIGENGNYKVYPLKIGRAHV